MECEHNGETYTHLWMGRIEKVCLDCHEVVWHEDKPMTWRDERGNVLLTFDDKDQENAR